MPLAQIRYFYEVAKAGSIREASSRLNVTPSSISRQIQNLEHEVKTSLFERRARGMVLTNAGELYLNYARLVLLELDRLHSNIDDLKGLRRGHVRIHAVYGIADALANSIVGFRRRYPGITFELTASGESAIINAIQGSECEIGVTFNSQTHAPPSHVDLRNAFSISGSLNVISHPSNPICKRKKAALADVLKYSVAVPGANFTIRKLINQCSHEQRLVLRPALVTNSLEALRSFARNNAGVTILPRSAVADDIESGRLASVPLSDPILINSSFGVCVSAVRELSLSAAEFLQHLEVDFSNARKIKG